MAKLSPDDALVNARIVYWGAEGSGKSENFRTIYRGLRSDLRGSLKSVPTRIDPTVEYEVLPIELGDVGGFRTAIEMVAVPGAADHAPTRKQLLDEVDGIVLVVDSQADRIADNEASLQELRGALSDYGRSLEQIPLVIQYNKRDLSDPYTLDDLHRRLQVRGAAVFETVATDASGVLKTLSTLSKRVVRTLRDRKFDVSGDTAPIDPAKAEASEPAEVSDEPGETRDHADLMEDAILSEATHPESDAITDLAEQTEDLLDESWGIPSDDSDVELGEFDESDGLASLEGVSSRPPQLGPELSIESVGEATRDGERGVRVPIVVADKQGHSATLVLTISLDMLAEDGAPGRPPHETPD